MEEKYGDNVYWKIEDDNSLMLQNKHYTRILIATPSCIVAGLDFSKIYSVVRHGLPTSIMHLSQKLGSCGRTISKTNKGVTGNLDSIINTDGFLYLNKRLYVKENKDGLDNA